jgi:hypothetical protein
LTDIDPLAERWRVTSALLVASALNIPFGTIYAFSVFLRPMEQQLAVSRTEMSVVFASATVALALGMNLLPLIARRLSGAMLIPAAGLIGALGLVIVTCCSVLGADSRLPRFSSA